MPSWLQKGAGHNTAGEDPPPDSTPSRVTWSGKFPRRPRLLTTIQPARPWNAPIAVGIRTANGTIPSKPLRCRALLIEVHEERPVASQGGRRCKVHGSRAWLLEAAGLVPGR